MRISHKAAVPLHHSEPKTILDTFSPQNSTWYLLPDTSQFGKAFTICDCAIYNMDVF